MTSPAGYAAVTVCAQYVLPDEGGGDIRHAESNLQSSLRDHMAQVGLERIVACVCMKRVARHPCWPILQFLSADCIVRGPVHLLLKQGLLTCRLTQTKVLRAATDSIQFDDETHSRAGKQRRPRSVIQQRLVRLQKMGSPTGKQAMAKRRTRAQGRERLTVMLTTLCECAANSAFDSQPLVLCSLEQFACQAE